MNKNKIESNDGIGIAKVPEYICPIHGNIGQVTICIQVKTGTNVPNYDSKNLCPKCLIKVLEKHITEVTIA